MTKFVLDALINRQFVGIEPLHNLIHFILYTVLDKVLKYEFIFRRYMLRTVRNIFTNYERSRPCKWNLA